MIKAKWISTILILILITVSCAPETVEQPSSVVITEQPSINQNDTDQGSSTVNASQTIDDSLKPLSSENISNSKLSVITIGTGIPAYSDVKANASTAIHYNGKYYVLDCGDGSYANMEANDFDFKQIAGIFFTHHHIDHTTDFFDLYVKCVMTGVENFQLVGPPRTSLFIDFVNDVFLDDVLYRKLNTTKNPEHIDTESFADFADVTEITGSETLEIDGITITTAEMTHTMYNLAYRFEANGQSIVVSGDTSYDEDLINLSMNADILVIDGSLYQANTNNKESKEVNIQPFYEFGGDFNAEPHLSFEDMVTIADEANVQTLIITHYNESSQERIDQSIAKIQESFKGEVIYAVDMQEIFVSSEQKQKDSAASNASDTLATAYPYTIVDTNQTEFYTATSIIAQPDENSPYYGQDASYSSSQPSYTDNEDGSITDNVTGLTWAQDMGSKMTYDEAIQFANKSTLAGYDDWRIPTIKELYSLIQFDGRVFGEKATDTLFINTDYFNQPLGDTSIGEREIDAQTWSSTMYVGETMRNDSTVFGVNFIDGRIKGYPTYSKKNKTDNTMYFRLVRGNTAYGENNFVENGDGTITDLATGLTWQQDDSGYGMDWVESLDYAENLTLGDHDDWRLPNAKELQSIVDYNRSLQTSNSPAIDPIFNTSEIRDPDGQVNYPYFWTGTSHLDGKNPYTSGVYIAFGEALGEMNGTLMDVHGAGAQRSDPKTGDEADYPEVFGPQGDIRIVYNYVRCVRND